MPTKWTPERKRQYARERYRRLQKDNGKKQKISKSRIYSLKKPSSKDQFSDLNRFPLPGSTLVSLTGNPFVDTGLAVIATRAGIETIDGLTMAHMREVHKDGIWLAHDSQQLKCYTMIFTRNSLLTQYPKIDRKGMKKRRVEMQAAITSSLLDSIGKETVEDHCESCGNEKSVNLAELVNESLAKFGEECKDRFIGRNWFPMAGSMGSDAQTLPAASKAVSLCAKCLFAVQYLPLGVRLYGRELSVFQSTDTKFWYEFERNISKDIQSRIANNSFEIVGSKEGRGGLARQLLVALEKIQKEKIMARISTDTRLYAWRFANSTAPTMEVDEIPNHALQFLWNASQSGLKSEIQSIVSKERVPEEYGFYISLLKKKDYFGLYPGKMGKDRDFEGVSSDLFFLYQTEILGRSSESLRAAHRIAKITLKRLSLNMTNIVQDTKKRKSRKRANEVGNQLLRLSRREAFSESSNRSFLKRIMVEETEGGRFNLRMYLDLFPYVEASFRVTFSGWDLIRYYFGRVARGNVVEFGTEKEPHEMVLEQNFNKLMFYGTSIFERHVSEHGEARFRRDVMERLKRNKIDARWLRSQFVFLARDSEGFEYSDWLALCFDNKSRWTLDELLFELRIVWTEQLKQPVQTRKMTQTRASSIDTIIQNSLLPKDIALKLLRTFEKYSSSRGLPRAKKDILDGLQRGDLGLGWFRRKLLGESESKMKESEFTNFIEDTQGLSSLSERIFQLSLFLNNIYRVMESPHSGETMILEAVQK